MINFWSYLLQYEEEKEQIYNAIERVMKSGRVILGESLSNFEKEFANYCNVKYGIGVNSGTDALFIALKTLEIGKGDEVINVPNTAIPTVSAICTTGAKPVFVDVNPKTFLINVNQIREHITKNTKCVLPVHLYGQCCDMDAILEIANEHNLYIVEDCAQSTGAKWRNNLAGSMSTISAFSFYPTKILGGYGDAGMVMTNSQEYEIKARMLRMYGMKPYGEYYSYTHGFNSRLDEIQAEILRFKLTRINNYIKRRQDIANKYKEGLKNTFIELQEVHPNAFHSYYLFVCKHKNRDEIFNYMKKNEIILSIDYKYPIHLMDAYKYLGYKEGDFPVTESLSEQIFSLPIYPWLPLKDQEIIISKLKQF